MPLAGVMLKVVDALIVTVPGVGLLIWTAHWPLALVTQKLLPVKVALAPRRWGGARVPVTPGAATSRVRGFIITVGVRVCGWPTLLFAVGGPMAMLAST